ncbi:MAG: hypothetical protein COB15_03995 [Flavobacteriales bacterium]|nr:MAG: hypothetical protein COB15_03995 [Flavobacteriales bacterium]
MTKIDLNIIGAGGHTRSIISSFKDQYNFIGIYDDSYNINSNEIISQVTLKGKIEDLPGNNKLVLAIGDNKTRANLYNSNNINLKIDSLIHKSSIICPSSKIGDSNQIFPNVFINGETEIGNNNIINSCCIIEHESKIGSHCHISIGTVISGRVEIGDCVFVGANATIIDKLKIVSDVTIGAGSVVITDIMEAGTYVGNPARKIK